VTVDPPLRRRCKALLPYLPVSLLVLVALAQTVLVLKKDLTRWKGGGFGMFSTADTPFARFLRIYVVVAEHEYAVPVPASLRDVAQAARVLPTQARVDDLAQRLARGKWVRDDTALLDPDSRDTIRHQLLTMADVQVDDVVDQIDQLCRQRASRARTALLLRMMGPNDLRPPSATVIEPEEIRVELWRYRFDDESKQLNAWKVRVARVEHGRS
jgi:hypothetical protein